MQACIAGYINRWWFAPNLDNSEKLDAVRESLVQAMVYSFGSVCFGSLFIAPVSILRNIAEHIRPNREGAPIRALVVVQEFIVTFIDYVVSVFHDFAMVSVGKFRAL